MQHDILIITRTRCWNRGGFLFPDTQGVPALAIPMTPGYEVFLKRFLETLLTHDPEWEEGYDDLYKAACEAPRTLRYLDRHREPLGGTIDPAHNPELKEVAVYYGDDNGGDSPYLVETFTLSKIGTQWDFVAGEEFHHAHQKWVEAGVLTDGKRFLYWNITATPEGPVRHIHNSIAMDADTEEVWYPLTGSNDDKVLAALNDPQSADRWCGDDSVLLEIDFEDA